MRIDDTRQLPYNIQAQWVLQGHRAAVAAIQKAGGFDVVPVFGIAVVYPSIPDTWLGRGMVEARAVTGMSPHSEPPDIVEADDAAALLADLTGEDLRIDFWRERLPGACLAGANLTGVVATRTNWTEADVSYSAAACLNGTKATMPRLRAIRAGLAGARLRSADLTRACFYQADLYRATLRDADLTHADLRSADLRSADLRGADLTEACLAGADLTGAYMDARTKTAGANFTRAQIDQVEARGPDSFLVYTQPEMVARAWAGGEVDILRRFVRAMPRRYAREVRDQLAVWLDEREYKEGLDE